MTQPGEFHATPSSNFEPHNIVYERNQCPNELLPLRSSISVTIFWHVVQSCFTMKNTHLVAVKTTVIWNLEVQKQTTFSPYFAYFNLKFSWPANHHISAYCQYVSGTLVQWRKMSISIFSVVIPICHGVFPSLHPSVPPSSPVRTQPNKHTHPAGKKHALYRWC